MAIPLVGAIGGYAYYNYARFGSVTEFGVTYQVTLQNFWVSPDFVIPNIYSYLFAPVEWSCRFPFVWSLEHRPLSGLVTWPQGYQIFEKVSGILIMTPWCWLILISVWRLTAHLWRRVKRPGLARQPRINSIELWALLCSLAVLPAMGPVLGLWMALMRYPADVIGSATIASTIGAFWLLRRANRSKDPIFGGLVRVFLVGLAFYTCFVGALSAIATYTEPMRTQNPRLYASLEKALSICAKR